MPGALVEPLFITNPGDPTAINLPNGVATLVGAITVGVEEYLAGARRRCGRTGRGRASTAVDPLQGCRNCARWSTSKTQAVEGDDDRRAPRVATSSGRADASRVRDDEPVMIVAAIDDYVAQPLDEARKSRRAPPPPRTRPGFEVLNRRRPSRSGCRRAPVCRPRRRTRGRSRRPGGRLPCQRRQHRRRRRAPRQGPPRTCREPALVAAAVSAEAGNARATPAPAATMTTTAVTASADWSREPTRGRAAVARRRRPGRGGDDGVDQLRHARLQRSTPDAPLPERPDGQGGDDLDEEEDPRVALRGQPGDHDVQDVEGQGHRPGRREGSPGQRSGPGRACRRRSARSGGRAAAWSPGPPVRSRWCGRGRTGWRSAGG